MRNTHVVLLVFFALIALFSFFYYPLAVPSFAFLLDDFSYQLSYVFSGRPLASDVALVLIDNRSIQELNEKWPFKRSRYARLLDTINAEGPVAVGFDVVFQGSSSIPQEDEDMARSLAASPVPIVLVSYLEDDSFAEPPESFKSAARIGFVYAPLVGKKIRSLATFRTIGGVRHASLAVQMASAAAGADANKEGSTLLLKHLRVPLQKNDDSFLINYLLKPKDVPAVSLSDALAGRIPQGFFKDKIVLVGASADIVHDIFQTPLGQMPGVYAHLNGITTLLSGRTLTAVPWSVSVVILLLLIGLVALVLVSVAFLKGVLLVAGLVLAVLWASVGLHMVGFRLPAGPLALSTISFFVLGNLYNYFRFFRMLIRVKNTMVIEPLTGLYTLRYFFERADCELHKVPHSRLVSLVIYIEHFSASIKGRQYNELAKLWLALSQRLRATCPLWSRCGEDVLVGVVPGKVNFVKLQKSIGGICADFGCTVNVRIGWLVLDRSLNIRDVVTLMAEQIKSSTERLVVFNKKDLARQRQTSRLTHDFVSLLCSDADQMNRELQNTLEKLLTEEQKNKEAYLQLIYSLINALESKDPYTKGHSQRVCGYSLLLAGELNIPDDEKEKLRKASLLHDLGKIGIPDSILHKRGSLTEEEFSFMKEHEILSVKILEPVKEFNDLVPYIMHHHESFDGSGYPHGLAGNFIPLGARILAVADVFDALVTGRDYKQAFSPQKAEEELIALKGRKLDPVLVDVFIKIIRSQRGLDIPGKP